MVALNLLRLWRKKGLPRAASPRDAQSWSSQSPSPHLSLPSHQLPSVAQGQTKPTYFHICFPLDWRENVLLLSISLLLLRNSFKPCDPGRSYYQPRYTDRWVTQWWPGQSWTWDPVWAEYNCLCSIPSKHSRREGANKDGMQNSADTSCVCRGSGWWRACRCHWALGSLPESPSAPVLPMTWQAAPTPVSSLTSQSLSGLQSPVWLGLPYDFIFPLSHLLTHCPIARLPSSSLKSPGSRPP